MTPENLKEGQTKKRVLEGWQLWSICCKVRHGSSAQKSVNKKSLFTATNANTLYQAWLHLKSFKSSGMLCHVKC
jgi:hypothetical protein